MKKLLRLPVLNRIMKGLLPMLLMVVSGNIFGQCAENAFVSCNVPIPPFLPATTVILQYSSGTYPVCNGFNVPTSWTYTEVGQAPITITENTNSDCGGVGYNHPTYQCDGTGNFTITAGGLTCTYVGGVLPIELAFFRGNITDGNNVLLTWETVTEKDNDKFVIERSSDGKTFIPIAELDGAGNSYETISYEFMDDEPLPGTNYYRLKQVDFDGKYSSSKLVSVELEHAGDIVMYPNPANEVLSINFPEALLDRDAEMEIYKLSGEKVMSRQWYVEDLTTQLETAGLNEGFYLLSIKTAQAVYNKTFVIQR